MALYMLDTDISSYIMKRSSPTLLQKLQTVAVGDLCISAITKSELMFGVEISPRRQKDQLSLDEYLQYVQVSDYPGDAALHYAQIRAHLKTHGTTIGANDLLIAAHARYLGLTLVTNNIGEFRRVPKLRLENWTQIT
jgi:tRNA(fMet)-specific endonuclease VapC